MIRARRDSGHAFSVSLPKAVRGRWCWLQVGPASPRPAIPVGLRIQQHHRQLPVAEQYAIALPNGIASRLRFAMIFYPADADVLHLDVYGIDATQQTIAVRTGPVLRGLAGLAVSLRFPLRLLSAVRGSPLGVFRRVRSRLALLAQQQPRRLAYEMWTEIFDQWSEDDRRTLLASRRRSEWPTIDVLVFDPAGAAPPLQATLASLRAQWRVASFRVSPSGQSLAQLRDRSRADYVAVLQAGEVLAPHALAVLADQAVRLDFPDAITADEDRIDPHDVRSGPHFKPEIGAALLLSGTLTQGIWLFRRARLFQLADRSYASGDAARLDIALELTGGRLARVPFVLTHRRFDIAQTPAALLGAVVTRHLDRAGLAATVEAGSHPIQVRRLARDRAPPKICIIVPTAARSRHVTRCVARVLAQTDYPNFELRLIVSQTGALDRSQRRILAPLLADHRVRLSLLQTPRFNYSRANNHGVDSSVGELICLLNDDVAPLDDQWLSRMAGHLDDPSVGAVGAKLVYPNNTLQHGGVIIGLAGLAEHAHRFLAWKAPGYAYRAMLDQDLSCVTGACLLTRRAIFKALGGMDETFEIAFNDIDFCLRLRDAGWRIVFAAQAVLRHYESASLGHHFAGDRADLEQQEVERMRRRWHAACLADPFHNPNLSLQRGHEWGLAFPPRVAKPFGTVTQEGQGSALDPLRAVPLEPIY